jgi:protein-tyrosine phosphatase
VNEAGRPYFYVATDGGAGVWTAERVLPLQGGRNFRDLGGYPTSDGRRVKWGKVYRSGSMAGLTEADYAYLSDLGVKVVCDLRTTEERRHEPNKWVAAQNIAYWTRDYSMSSGELGKLFSGGRMTPAQMKAAMTETYRTLPFEQAPAYREMFKRLAAGEVPLAFNCSAGKDRAGTGAALILTALGVPRETVVADYALSDKVVDFRKAFARDAEGAEPSPFAKLPPEVVAPLLASDPDYIRAMFAAIERRHGSVDHYLQKELGVTTAELEAIRTRLLE